MTVVLLWILIAATAIAGAAWAVRADSRHSEGLDQRRELRRGDALLPSRWYAMVQDLVPALAMAQRRRAIDPRGINAVRKGERGSSGNFATSLPTASDL